MVYKLFNNKKNNKKKRDNLHNVNNIYRPHA